MYPDVDAAVHVYAAAGDDLQEHLKRIDGFNTRTNDPTHWREVVYTGPDYLAKMLAYRAGNVVVIAGNNAHKTDCILRSVAAGLNVLADKPMVITPDNFPKLQLAFAVAQSNHVLLCDIMTERFEITTMLQRELSQWQPLFGELEKGSPTNPAIVMQSVHYFSKTVAGSALKRPQWFFDVRQEGEGIVDVSTHLVDLVQWEAFPDQALDPGDVQVLSARRWATPISREQFKHVTGADDFPAYLKGDITNGVLPEYANGEFTYRLRDVYANVSVQWNFDPPPNGSDTHFSVVRGTWVDLNIRQGAAENFKPVLYVTNHFHIPGAFEDRVAGAVSQLQKDFPGVAARRIGNREFRIDVPDKYDVGHEAHFAQVTENYLGYLRDGHLPAWEVPNMLTKYATIMRAYEMSR
jgi:predicted dehydrogenase